MGYRLRHRLGGRPLAVVGHYEVTGGGCDTIRAADGGLGEIMRRAADYAASGHDVLLEIDVDGLLGERASVGRMVMAQDRPGRETLSQVEGIAISTQPEVTVRFRE